MIKQKMLIHNVRPWHMTGYEEELKRTAEVTGYPEFVVRDCVEHLFSNLKGWLREPWGKGAVMLHDFGTFSLNLRAINRSLEAMILLLKKDRTHKGYLKKFRELWRKRQLAIEFENRRKGWNRSFHFAKEVL